MVVLSWIGPTNQPIISHFSTIANDKQSNFIIIFLIS